MSQVADFKIDEDGYITLGRCKIRRIPDYDKPSTIWLHEDDIVKSKSWHAPVLHRDDGPASVECNKQGKPVKEMWYSYGQLHRIGGPAVIKYDDNGKVIYQRFYVDGKKRFWKNLFHGVG